MLAVFFEEQRKILLQKLKKYLSQEISHQDMKEYIWSFWDEWEKLPNRYSEPMLEIETSFWSIFWTMLHLADDEHWNDGITEPEVRNGIDLLEGKKSLPIGSVAKRP